MPLLLVLFLYPLFFFPLSSPFLSLSCLSSLLQVVLAVAMYPAQAILWEMLRTKEWSGRGQTG